MQFSDLRKRDQTARYCTVIVQLHNALTCTNRMNCTIGVQFYAVVSRYF